MTDVFTEAMLRVTRRSVGTTDRTSNNCENAAKPSRCTAKWYRPKGSNFAGRLPLESVMKFSWN